MKKWLLVSVAVLGLIGGGIQLTGTHLDHASAQSGAAAVVTHSKTPRAAATKVVKGGRTQTVKAASRSAKPATKAPASTKGLAKPVAAAPRAAAQTSAAAKASASRQQATTAKAPAQAQPRTATTLTAYYGTWHNAAVTITLTAAKLTVAQPGQPSLTTTYQVAASGRGYLFTPTAIEADPLQLELVNGQLLWATGASAPLVLVR
ncbi:hypothetical protein ACFQ3L_05405 [Lacticaseibacillus jixianensis]|uniref:Uncharacterized protein n=1 Tax=Lacticaseibacillus jixianensis TaxID=2486012 RepID=A0ABW4B9L2_9LACO|nr:hypothetical protein [Lacticaseibacillus jixianensis]